MKVTREDWQAAIEQMRTADRERLGDPPTWEECEAYAEGRMDEAQQERMRELFCAYPEIARVMFADEPEDGEGPHLPEEQIAEGWRKLKRSLGIE